MRVAFAEAGYGVGLKVEVNRTRITFTVTDVSGAQADELILLDLPLNFTGVVGETVGVVRDEATAVGVQGLNWFTDAGAADEPGRVRLHAVAVRQAGLAGARWAVFSCPAAEVLDLLEQIEKEEPGLPHFTDAKGRWLRTSPEVLKPYMVVYQKDLDWRKAIDYAVRGGFSYLYMGDPTWSKNWGHFEINEGAFPGGEEELVEFARVAAGRGVKLGFHTLSGAITNNDPYVSPVPDPRLAVRGSGKLTGDVSASDPDISVSGLEGDFCFKSRYYTGTFLDNKFDAFLSGGAFVIGSEILRCEHMSMDESSGVATLGNCTRGAYGTSPAGHRKGETISRLTEEWAPGLFFPDVKSSLLVEMAARLAELGNRVGLAMTSFDGWEGLRYDGNYGCNRFLHEILERWDKPMISDASMQTHFGWHVFARFNWGENTYDVRGDMEKRSRYSNFRTYKRNYYAPGAGWQWFKRACTEGEASSVDEIEYLFAKAAGFRAACALDVNMGDLDGHGGTAELLADSSAWQQAAAADAFTEVQRERMRQKGTDFHLEQCGKKHWKLTERKWSRRTFLRLDGSAAMDVHNPFGAQSPELTVLALSRFERENRENIRVPLEELHFGYEDQPDALSPEINVEKAAAGLRVSARRKGANGPAFACLWSKLPEPLDLSAHRGVGLEVTGDGSGALLVVELKDAAGQVRQYYWRIDFTGNRWLELPNGETGMEQYYDHPAWGSPWFVTQKWFDYTHVAKFCIGFNALSAEAPSECVVGSLRFLSEIREPVRDLKIQASKGACEISGELQPGRYIRLAPDGSGKLYDSNWNALGEFEATGAAPAVEAGTSRWRLDARGNPGNWICARTCFAKGPEEIVL